MTGTLDSEARTCIIRIVGDRVEAHWVTDRGRPRNSLVAYVSGDLVQWKTACSTATIGRVEHCDDGTTNIIIPVS
jgi:hypothetical protein